jgi:hypothetical protein
MAEKLSIQIALDGGAEIEKQLQGIGEAGQKAFADISKSAEQAGGFKQLKPEEVTQKLKDMGVTGVDSIEKIQKAVQSAKNLETLVQGITSVETGLSALAAAAPIVGTAIVAAFALATKAVFAFSDAVNKVSDEAAKLGVSIENVDQFRRGLEQAGISAQGISAALAQVKSDADKISLEQVKRDAQDVQKAIDRGVGGGQVAEQFKRLQKTAEQFTEAGKAARAELVKMGEGVPGTTFEDVQKLGVELAKLKGLGIDIKVSDDAVTQAQKIITALAQLPDKALAAQIAMQRFGAAGPELVAGLRTGSITVDQFAQKFATLTAEQEAAANKMRQSTEQLSADWERFKSAIGAPIAIAGIAGLTAVFDAIKGGIATTVQEFTALGSAINSVATVGAQVIAALAAPIQLVIDAVSQLGSALGSITWDSIASAGVAAWNALTGAIQKAIDAVLQFIGLKPSAPATGGSAPGKAAGGLLGGRGTGTSDSNLAWLSRGEYITPARAVAQPGVLAFLEALRRSGGNLSRVLDGMGRFALGGMVPRMPAFAAGGLAGGSNVTIQFPGLPAIGGLRASADVVDQLHRAAALAQVRSGGRKPSRYA